MKVFTIQASYILGVTLKQTYFTYVLMSLFPLLEESAIPDTLAPLCDLTIFMHVIINDKELCKKQKQKNKTSNAQSY